LRAEELLDECRALKTDLPGKTGDKKTVNARCMSPRKEA
jgi:hypothetical protein